MNEHNIFKQLPMYGENRKCRICNKTLSVYNPNQFCLHHNIGLINTARCEECIKYFDYGVTVKCYKRRICPECKNKKLIKQKKEYYKRRKNGRIRNIKSSSKSA